MFGEDAALLSREATHTWNAIGNIKTDLEAELKDEQNVYVCRERFARPSQKPPDSSPSPKRQRLCLYEKSGHPCPCCNGTGFISSRLPDFASFECTKFTLWSLLDNLYIDEQAKALAFLVCQKYGEAGIENVQNIALTLLKRWKFVENKPAFMAGGCSEFIKDQG